MPNLLRILFDFLLVPISLIGGSLIASLIYKWFINKKKEQEKIKVAIKQMEDLEWDSPMFSNAGFYIGSFILLLALFITRTNFIAEEPFPWWMLILIYGFGFWFMWIPSIRLRKEFIEIQPLLMRLLHLPFIKRIIFYHGILDIKKVRPELYSEFFVFLKIKTHSGTIKLNTGLYNSEIAHVLYEILIKKINPTV